MYALYLHIDPLVQGCSISIANALEILQGIFNSIADVVKCRILFERFHYQLLECKGKQAWLSMMTNINNNTDVFTVSEFNSCKQFVISNIILSKQFLVVLFPRYVIMDFLPFYEVHDWHLVWQALLWHHIDCYTWYQGETIKSIDPTGQWQDVHI